MAASIRSAVRRSPPGWLGGVGGSRWLGRLLWRQVPAYTMGMVTACIAGLMITISCEELIPASPGGSDRLSAMPALMAGVILVLVLRQLLG
mgnify:CR=1 FL=1